MATSDEASEWGTAVLVRSGSDQPFDVTALGGMAEPAPEGRYQSLLAAAQSSLASSTPDEAVPILEHLAAERPDDTDVTALLERVTHPASERERQSDAEPGATEADQELLDRQDREREERAAREQERADRERDRVARERDRVARERGRNRWGRRRIRPWFVVKLVLWGAVLVAGFVVWRLAPTLLQKVEPFVQSACGSASETTSPRSSFVVGCAPLAPTVDGEFEDWRSVPWHSSPAVVDRRGGLQGGLAATWQVLWDKDALYLHARVTDDNIVPVKSSRPGSFWNGDGVSFEFGTDPRGLSKVAQVRPGKDFHVMFGLVNDGDRRALASINPASRGTFAATKQTAAIDVVRRETGDGYELEARVIWKHLGLTVPPARGTIVGMNVNVSDALPTGSLKAMMSSNPERTASAQNHPRLWQTVLLGDES
jgi:hypothetical protein